MLKELFGLNTSDSNTANQRIPHPTMSEAVMEAAAAAYDEVIHL